MIWLADFFSSLLNPSGGPTAMFVVLPSTVADLSQFAISSLVIAAPLWSRRTSCPDSLESSDSYLLLSVDSENCTDIPLDLTLFWYPSSMAAMLLSFGVLSRWTMTRPMWVRGE